MKFPIFPLNGAILFPETNLPLNIFEEKYLQMVDYAFSKNKTIGMIQSKKNNDFFNVGCLGKITSFSETEDGRYQINLRGLNRFYLKKIVKSHYKFIIIEADILETTNNVLDENKIKKKLLSAFNKFLKTKKIKFNTSGFENMECSNLLKLICVIAPLDYLIKQMLLELDNFEDLYKNLLSVLEVEMKNLENIKLN